MAALPVRMIFAISVFGLGCAAPCVAFTEQHIVSRQEWNAHAAIPKRQPPIQTGKVGDTTVVSENELIPRQEAGYLTVHHTAVPSKPAVATPIKLRAFQQQMQNGYWIITPILRKHIFLGDIPYHFYISAQGDVAEGRELKFAAYSNTRYQTPIENHITVTLEGNFEKEQPSPKQISSLIELLSALAKEYSVSLNHIRYHAQVAETDCPGKNLITKWPEIITALQVHRYRAPAAGRRK